MQKERRRRCLKCKKYIRCMAQTDVSRVSLRRRAGASQTARGNPGKGGLKPLRQPGKKPKSAKPLRDFRAFGRAFSFSVRCMAVFAAAGNSKIFDCPGARRKRADLSSLKAGAKRAPAIREKTEVFGKFFARGGACKKCLRI